MRVKLFLDSGAFSAFKTEAEVNLLDYISFIKRNEQYIEHYAALDVIGDAAATLRNQQIMEAAGLSPVPTFHRGEDFSYLKLYAVNYPLVALGGTAQSRSASGRIRWLDRCFDVLCDADGRPVCKVHGFAITAVKMMLRYPWYSVDSTRWVKVSRNGIVLVPYLKADGTADYHKPIWQLSVSYSSPTMNVRNRNIWTLSKAEKKFFTNYFESRGISVGLTRRKKVKPSYKLRVNETWIEKGKLVQQSIRDGITNSYVYRDRANLIFFNELVASINAGPEIRFLKGNRASRLFAK